MQLDSSGSTTDVWPFGEGAAKPGIEWPEGTHSALAYDGALFRSRTKYFITLGASIPLVFPFSKGGRDLPLDF